MLGSLWGFREGFPIFPQPLYPCFLLSAWSWTSGPKRCVSVLTPGTYERDTVWK